MAGQSDGETIAASGDVILKVGKEPATTTLRVSSPILMMTSSVFDTLLGPNFREGSTPRSIAKPVVIPLPDDNPQAVLDMCLLLHFKSMHKTDDDLSKRLHDLAITVDKYDCIDALRVLIRALLQSIPLPTGANKTSTPELKKVIYMISASCLLYDDVSYGVVVTTLIQTVTVPYSELRKETTGARGFPGDLLLAMEEKRGLIRQGVAKDALIAVQHGCYPCEHDNTLADKRLKYLCKVFECDTWPPSFTDQGILIAQH